MFTSLDLGPAAEIADYLHDSRAKLTNGLLDVFNPRAYISDAEYRKYALLTSFDFVAGHLRIKPGLALTDRAIDVPESASTISRLLIEHLNDSFAPRGATPGIYSHTTVRRMRRMGSCAAAEPRFQQVLNGTETPPGAAEHPIVAVLDEDGKAVFLRKNIVEPSAISLQDTIIDGVAFKAGSLFNLRRKKDAEPAARYARSSGQHLATYPVSAIDRVSYLRPSAFALPVDERGDTFAEFVGIDPADYLSSPYTAPHATTQLDDFRNFIVDPAWQPVG